MAGAFVILKVIALDLKKEEKKVGLLSLADPGWGWGQMGHVSSPPPPLLGLWAQNDGAPDKKNPGSALE